MAATITPPPTPQSPATPEVTAWVGSTRLTAAMGISYEEVHNDVGSWSLSIPLNDATATERALLDYGTVVTFKEFGDTAFVGIVEEIQQVTVAEGEEGDQVVTFSGRSILAELEQAVVYGPIGFSTWVGGSLDGLRLGRQPYTDTRYWNYASVGLDRSTWTPAVELVTAGQNPALFPPNGFAGAPTPWPRPASKWIAPRAISDGKHPQGAWYAYGTITVSGAMSYDVICAGGVGDAVDLWCDGAPILRIDAKDALKPHKVNLVLNAGTHHFVARIDHGGNDDTGNITGFILELFKHFPDGGGWTEAPLGGTSSSWVCADYPATPPGYRVCQIVAEMIDEAQVRGALPGWEKGWGSTTDSAGETSPFVPEVAVRTGTKVLDALRQLAEVYLEFAADFTGTNGRRLDYWEMPSLLSPGGGDFTDVELEPGVNVLELTHHGTKAEITTLIARWAGGWYEIPPDEDLPRREGFLSIPDARDGPQALFTGGHMVNNLKVPSESIENLRHRLHPDTQYRCRDRVTAPDRSGSPQWWRVVGRAVDTDEDGNGFVTAQLGVPRDDVAARNERWSRRIAGTLDGRSENAQIGGPFMIDTRTLTPVQLRFTTGGGGVTIVGDRGSPDRPEDPLLLVEFLLESDVAGLSGATTVRVEVNGNPLGTATLPSGQNYARAVLTPTLVSKLDYVNVETTAAGGHQGVSATVIGMAAT